MSVRAGVVAAALLLSVGGAARAAPVSVDSLERQITGDLQGTRARLVGKPIEVAAVIGQVHAQWGPANRPVIKLGASANPIVVCMLDAPGDFRQGEAVVASGLVTEVSDLIVGSGVRIEHCSAHRVAQAAVPPPPSTRPGSGERITAMQLWKTLGNTPAMDAYAGKTVSVTGFLDRVSAFDVGLNAKAGTLTHVVACAGGQTAPWLAHAPKDTPVVATGKVSRIFHGFSGYFLLEACTLTRAGK